MRENTDQKKLRIWTLFTQWEFSVMTVHSIFCCLAAYYTQYHIIPSSTGTGNTCKVIYLNIKTTHMYVKVKSVYLLNNFSYANFQKRQIKYWIVLAFLNLNLLWRTICEDFYCRNARNKKLIFVSIFQFYGFWIVWKHSLKSDMKKQD